MLGTLLVKLSLSSHSHHLQPLKQILCLSALNHVALFHSSLFRSQATPPANPFSKALASEASHIKANYCSAEPDYGDMVVSVCASEAAANHHSHGHGSPLGNNKQSPGKHLGRLRWLEQLQRLDQQAKPQAKAQAPPPKSSVCLSQQQPADTAEASQTAQPLVLSSSMFGQVAGNSKKNPPNDWAQQMIGHMAEKLDADEVCARGHAYRWVRHGHMKYICNWMTKFTPT